MTGLLIYLLIGFIIAVNTKLNDQRNIGTMLLVTLLWPIFALYFLIGMLFVVFATIAISIGLVQGNVKVTKKEKK